MLATWRAVVEMPCPNIELMFVWESQSGVEPYCIPAGPV